MAIVASMSFPGHTLAEYDAVMTEAGLMGAGLDKVPGAHGHYAWEEDGTLHVLDVWESPDAFNAFFSSTIGPAAARAGVTLNPQVTVAPLHNSIPKV